MCMQLSGASKASTATHTVEGSAIVIEDCSDDEEAERKPCPCLVQFSTVQLARGRLRCHPYLRR